MHLFIIIINQLFELDMLQQRNTGLYCRPSGMAEGISQFHVYISADDDIDVDNLHDEELQLYFNKLIPTAMQRGRVEGQEIPAAVSCWCT